MEVCFFGNFPGTFLGALIPFIALPGLKERKPEPEERKFRVERKAGG